MVAARGRLGFLAVDRLRTATQRTAKIRRTVIRDVDDVNTVFLQRTANAFVAGVHDVSLRVDRDAVDTQPKRFLLGRFDPLVVLQTGRQV